MKPPTCCRCQTAYVLGATESGHGPRGSCWDHGKYPLLLHCGHSLCRPCQRKCQTSEDVVQCPACQKATKPGSKGLSPDIYTVGLMWTRRLELERQSEKISSKDRVKDQKKPPAGGNASKTGPPCMECQKPASCHCLKCESALCRACFDKIHSKSLGLKKHRPVPLLEGRLLEDRLALQRQKRSRQCAAHEHCQIEYFCIQDNQPICSRCVILGDHRGHDVQTLEEKNKESLSEMEPAMQAAQEAIWRLDKAQETIGKAMPQACVDTSGLAEVVHLHFQHLHALLQAREEQLLEDIKTASVNVAKSFEETKAFLQTERMCLEMALMDASRAMQSSVHSLVDADRTVQQLQKARDLPCVVTLHHDAIGDPVRFSCEPSMVDIIGSYGSVLTVNATQLFTLSVPGPDAPKPSPEELQSVTLPDLDLASLDNESVSDSASVDLEEGPGLSGCQLTEDDLLQDKADPFRNVAGAEESCGVTLPDLERASSDRESVADSASVIVEEEETDSIAASGVTENCEASVLAHRLGMPLAVGGRQAIEVTHIRTPAQFYVQFCLKRGELETLQRHLNQTIRKAGNNHPPPSLQPGMMVVAQYSQDKNWYRAVVRETYEAEDKGSPSCEVFFIDYGNSERVPRSKLRPIKQKFESAPPYAYECTLYGVVPANQGRGWTNESVSVMLDMTVSGSIIIELMEVGSEGRLLVDVLKLETQRHCVDQRPTSLIHSLLFLHLAAPTPLTPPLPTGVQMEDDYISLARTVEGEVMTVRVTQPHTPSLFCAQPWQRQQRTYMQKVTRNMQDTYAGDNSHRYSLYCPRLGLMCVARSQQDGEWHRAKVTGVGGRGRVEVQFVDYGHTETVPYTDLRKILHNFIKFPRQAMECTLVDVEPAQDRQWSEEALTWFRRNTDKQVSQFRVVRDSERGNSTEGVLYVYSQEGELCCVNTELVKRGFAISTGKWSETASFEGITLQPTDSSSPLSSNSNPSPRKRGVKTKGGKQTSPATKSDGAKTPPLRNGQKGPGGEGEGKEEVQRKSAGVEVVICGYQSPAHFFIQLQKDQKDLLSLMQELAAYEAEPVSEREWKEGQFCAAKYSQDDKWYRAKITTLMEDSTVQVSLVDYGHVDSVPASRLRPLQNIHAQKECFAKRCHLADLAPAGSMDTSRWSATAVRFMADEITAKRLFVKLEICFGLGAHCCELEGIKEEAGGLPVDILVEHVIPETALEPLRLEYTSLISRIQDQGLAIPRRNKGTADSESTPQASPDYQPFHTRLTSSPSTLTSSPSALTSSPSALTPMPCDSPSSASGSVTSEADVGTKELPVVEQEDLKVSPHPPPASTTLIVNPTHVDSQGIIYAHDVQDEEDCTAFMDQVDHYAQHEAPRGRLQVKTGQLCLAFYPADGAWYRAHLLEVGHNHAKVKYIDYGNTELVDRDQLRQMPPELSHRHEMAFQFTLHNLKPDTVDNTWPASFVEYMDRQLVNQQCTALVKGDPTQLPVGVDLLYNKGESISAALLQIGVVSLENDMEEFYERTADITNILKHSNPYFPLRPGDKDTVLNGFVTHMELPNLVYIQRCASSPDNDLPKDLLQFAQMMDDLNDPPPQGPPLQELPAAGEVCCACFSHDDRWYRALVVKPLPVQGRVLVFYVDYGNSEEVTLDRLRPLPPELRDVPAQALRAFLNLDLPPDTPRWALATLTAMSELVFMRRHIVLIKFADPLTVELYSEEEHQQGASVLSYQQMIDNGLVALPQSVVAVEGGDNVVIESSTEGEEGKDISSTEVSDLD